MGPPGQYYYCNKKGKACLWPSPSIYLALGHLYYFSPEEYAEAKSFSTQAKLVKKNSHGIHKACRLLLNKSNMLQIHLGSAVAVVSLGGLCCKWT